MTRQSDFNDEIANEICLAIATGNLGIKKLCEKHKHWPARATVFRWLLEHPSFRDLYARAKKNQIEAYIDEVIDIADDSINDSQVDETGKTIINHDHINRARLRIDTRKWLACKLVPRVYGDTKQEKDNGEDAISQFRVE